MKGEMENFTCWRCSKEIKRKIPYVIEIRKDVLLLFDKLFSRKLCKKCALWLSENYNSF